MKVHLLRERATPQQVAEMLEELQTYIKLAVDVTRGIAAGGGEWHAQIANKCFWPMVVAKKILGARIGRPQHVK